MYIDTDINKKNLMYIDTNINKKLLFIDTEINKKLMYRVAVKSPYTQKIRNSDSI